VIHLLALLLYSAAFLFWLRSLIAGGRDRGALPAWTAAAGVVAHLAAVAAYTATFGELPLVGLGPSLSTLALLIGVGLVATLALREAQRIGIVILPLVILLQSFAMAAGLRPSGTAPDFRGGWFVLHAGLGLAGIVGMAMAGAAGTLYMAQFRQLKAKRMGRLFHFLPPLATLDRLGRLGTQAAFVLLTVSLALGWAWTVRFLGNLGGDTPEVWWGVYSWLLIAGAVGARRFGSGPPERRAALANSIGFLLIAAGYVLLRVTAQPGAGFL
jgi:HemX protein